MMNVNNRFHPWMLVIALCLACVLDAALTYGEVKLIDERTPWRVFTVSGAEMVLRDGKVYMQHRRSTRANACRPGA
ncbi:MAG: hypothetical protein JJU36_16120 [Phycisphaeraceae bacterium]|nr:hypothetical protein [Phycisphaeraceae bacterium]